MGFTEVLTLIFVVLKLTGVIDWSWWLVFTPSIAAGLFAIVVLTGLWILARPRTYTFK